LRITRSLVAVALEALTAVAAVLGSITEVVAAVV
jgi:hypothetical protein